MSSPLVSDRRRDGVSRGNFGAPEERDCGTSSMTTAAGSSPGRRWALLVGGAVTVYTAGFLLWYSATPLGLHPVLDGREMLALAEAIATGSLPHEPFYRAPLYPALLAGLMQLGVTADDLAFAARLLNGALHLASTALVWSSARYLWQRPGATALAALLYGLNPVVLHFAADPLDITLAVALVLAAVRGALSVLDTRPPGGVPATVLATTCFVLAGLARPQLLACLPAWWLVLATTRGRGRGRLAPLVAGVAPALLLLGAMGAINHALSDEFRVLPWQGAFDLWAANHRGANGRYFEQATRLASYSEGLNPARLEAERRYRADRPGARADIASMSAYWRARLRADIADDPIAWLALLVRKAWYLLNDFEQYNNKTYYVHKARSPWLAPNPLGWSVLLILGLLGASTLPSRRTALLFAALMLSMAGALLLTYVSARFRLPLVPLLAILAGGITRLSTLAPRRLRRAVGVSLLLGGASLVPLPAAERERTVVQDELLLARAALETGDADAALGHAAAALRRQPGHGAALEIGCVARFNAWLRGAQDDGAMAPIVAACRVSAGDSPVAQRVLGILAWRAGEDAAARAWLEPLAAAPGPERDRALAALLLSGLGVGGGFAAATCVARPCDDALLLALAARGDGKAAAALDARLGGEELARQAAALARTFRRVERHDDGAGRR
ncbi:MAG: hypothetical protein AB7Q81_18935 [Gammaproteobacteria bacterium]